MKINKINIKDNCFTTESGDQYPILFDIDNNITLEEFQKCVDISEKLINDLINKF
jgi:hypothetical protein